MQNVELIVSVYNTISPIQMYVLYYKYIENDHLLIKYIFNYHYHFYFFEIIVHDYYYFKSTIKLKTQLIVCCHVVTCGIMFTEVLT